MAVPGRVAALDSICKTVDSLAMSRHLHTTHNFLDLRAKWDAWLGFCLVVALDLDGKVVGGHGFFWEGRTLGVYSMK
jgi:hypothetical protein